LIGGGGDDLLFGGLGSDMYVYNIGDGTDKVFDPDGPNAVVFGPGIDTRAISLGVGSLLVRVGTAGIHFLSFDPANPYGPRDVDRFVFADGSVLAYEALIDRGFDLEGTSGADTINGTATMDRINAGHADDILAGGPGSDTYFYERGDGSDTIIESPDSGSIDVLQFGAGINPAGLAVTCTGVDIYMRLPNPGDRVLLRDWYSHAERPIEEVRFADGTTWSALELEGHVTDTAAANRAPQLAVPLADQVANEDALFSFAIAEDAFIDLDPGDSVTLTARRSDGSPLPLWLSFDSAMRAFKGTPDDADVGTIALRVTA